MKSVANVVLTLTLLLGLAVSSILAAPGDATAKSSTLTIGEFAVAVAKSMDNAPQTRTTLSPEAALAKLKDSGWSFSSASDAVLTQGEFAAFLRQAGVQISVPSPNQAVSAAQVKTAISAFGSLFASHGGESKATPPPVSDPTKHESVPNDFSQCAAQDKVPDCKACCLALGMTQQTCGRACGQANAGHVSASEPTP
jgi:hypothetical protein